MALTFAAVLFSGCDLKHADSGTEVSAPAPEVFDITDSGIKWADSVCHSLSLRQKIAQLFMPSVNASDDEWTLRLIRQYADSCIGGIVLLKGDSTGAARLVSKFSACSKVSPFVAIDAEWGLAMRLVDAPAFPANSEIGSHADDQLMYDYGYELARECRLLGINMVLGPVVDISARNSFMGKRSLGNDPERVADLALAYAQGVEDGNVISVAKHFPGHGSVTTDSHKRKGVIQRSLHELDSIDLFPFRMWSANHLTGIMVGHLAVPSIDSSLKPAAVSSVVINDLLREDLGFTGLVLSDALNMKGADGYDSADAITAGVDIVVAPDKTFQQIDCVIQAVKRGIIDEAEINARLKRVLFYKYIVTRHPSSAESAESALRTAATDSIRRKLIVR